MTDARINKSLKKPGNKKTTPVTQKPDGLELEEEGSAKLLFKIEIIPDYVDQISPSLPQNSVSEIKPSRSINNKGKK